METTWLGLKNNTDIKTNLFISTTNPRDSIVMVCFDELTKPITFKFINQKEFKDKFIILKK